MDKVEANAYKENKALRLIAEEEAKGTKKAQERAEEMRRLFANRFTDTCGWYGRLVEVASHSERSKQVEVARQGRADTYVKILVNGRVKYEAAEVKTNGGRIGSLLQGKAPRFIVYSLNLCNSTTGNAPRRLAPVVLRTEDFLRVLEECGAMKSTNGPRPEVAIQPSSKKMFLRLSEATRFDADRVYTLEEIVLG